MYRNYENPKKLQRMINEAKHRYDDYKLSYPDDIDGLIDRKLELDELYDRLRFAYDDEEYEEYDEGYR